MIFLLKLKETSIWYDISVKIEINFDMIWYMLKLKETSIWYDISVKIERNLDMIW